MTLKGDAKFKRKVTRGLKNDMRYSPEPNCREGGGGIKRGGWYFTTNL